MLHILACLKKLSGDITYGKTWRASKATSHPSTVSSALLSSGRTLHKENKLFSCGEMNSFSTFIFGMFHFLKKLPQINIVLLLLIK